MPRSPFVHNGDILRNLFWRIYLRLCFNIIGNMLSGIKDCLYDSTDTCKGEFMCYELAALKSRNRGSQIATFVKDCRRVTIGASIPCFTVAIIITNKRRSSSSDHL